MSGREMRAHCTRLNQFRERLSSGRFVVTAEVVPPVSCDPEELVAKVRPLRGLADAVNVTDGAGARAHMGSLAAAALILDAGVEPICSSPAAIVTALPCKASCWRLRL
jgi:methylenetetrahydrofolate reductase (NADPH)